MKFKGILIEKLYEFDNHRLISFLHDAKTGLQGFVAIHRGDLHHPSFGATRLWRYPNEMEALKDALRLSRGMSYKLAMAGLSYGGAKGVIMMHPGATKKRNELLKSYAERVNYFGGHFITGTDVGLNQDDLSVMRRASPYMVGIKSDATRFTGVGIFYGIKTCMKEIYGDDDLSKRSFAIQGVGKVGSALLKLLYFHAQKIFVADIDRRKIAEIKRMFPRVEVVKPSEIHYQKVDVFSPCALSRSVNARSIRELQCRIVAGGANNQLDSSETGENLHKRNILYAPDYVINAGGLITVVDEYEHKNVNVRRVMRRVLSIKRNLKNIFKISKKCGRAPHLVADEIAERSTNRD
ncbi:MAG: Leucine dehydrogenase [Parcubacteria group bacterium Gr01-1014_33]|nr:MAG: Leucine dehydrogenase [Parcubacteria group bacterium Gr01-1014_33]